MLARLECESLLDLNFGLPRAVQGSPAPHSCQRETHRIAASYPDHEDRDEDQDRDDLEHQDVHEDHDDLKGILHQKNFYRLNLIFWIVMGCGIACFGRRGLKTTET